MKLLRQPRVAALSYLLSVCGLARLCNAQQEAPPGFTAQQITFFETKIRPLLVEHCAECHSGDEPESGFSVESRAALLAGGEFGPAVKPGNPAGSLLVSAINHDEFLKMPPKEKLPTQQVVDLTRWVKMGAPWPDSGSAASATAGAEPRPGAAVFSAEQRNYWAFQPPDAPPLPTVVNTRWPQSPIDYMVLARLEGAGLSPAPPADKHTLIRRTTFDLTGLPPTPDELDAFLSDDSPLAYEHLVDRLLASPRYGERWGRHWLDVARYADSNGLDENLSYANAFRYRDYVITSFNKDKAYGRFVQEQIAGDLLPESADSESNLERLIATGFLAIGPKMLAEDDPTKMQMDIIDEQLSTIGQALMGLTLGCCRCHDHKFDPLPTRDYYSLAGILKSTKTMENHKVVAVWYERPLVTDQRARELAALDEQIKAAEKEITMIKSEARKVVAVNLRTHLKSYLTAALAVEHLQRRSRDAQGLSAATKQDPPFSVDDGYLVIEAEAFHRGNTSIVLDGYGKGIGIIGSSGAAHAEYDLDVMHAGQYAIEIRYAAAESRPLSLLLDGKKVTDSILAGVTGSWYPDTQRWVAEVRVDLGKGKHTLKLDSPRVYPHIDKLALVWAAQGEWPFDSQEPLCITRSAAAAHVDMALVSHWQKYFLELEQKKHDTHVAFRPWVSLRQLDPVRFVEQAAPLLAEIQSDAGLGKRLQKPLKDAFKAKPPQSIDDVATIYQTVASSLERALDSGEEDALKPFASLQAEFASDASPLSAPTDLPQASFPPELRQRYSELTARISTWRTSRPSSEVAMGVTEGKPADIRVHLRGNHITLGEIAPRRMPRIFAGEDQTPIGEAQSGRLEFANWLVHKDHPLVSRVIVNRIWRWRFGRGLVPTVDNFGALGERPTHPELLDWLASELVRQRGSLKALHRTMLLSSTYQMSSQYDATGDRQDPENNLLWRMRRRRLSGEEVRDSVLQIGPGLDLAIGGSLLKVKNRAYVTGSGTNITDEFDNHRRSVYLPVVRSSVYDVLQTLDFPDPAVSNGDRITTTVAPQALLMMNSSLVENSTRHLAQRLLSGAADRRTATAYQLVLGRQPSGDESDIARQFVLRARKLAQEQGSGPSEADIKAWQGFCRVLLSSNDFMYVE